VLKAIEEAKLQLNVNKCKFYKTEVTYLGYIVSTEGIQMDLSKINTILN
jgi:hypothetical protein